MTGAPRVADLQSYLSEAGFSSIEINIKEESKEVIKQWVPGSNAESFVLSADINAVK